MTGRPLALALRESQEKTRSKSPLFFRFIMALALAGLYLPLIVLLTSSLRDEAGSLTFQWYLEVVHDPELWQALERSLIVAVGSSLIATTLGTLAALALNRRQSFIRRSLAIISYVSLMIPELVLALSALSWFALFKIELGLLTVTTAHVTLTLPFVSLVVGARLSDLEPALDDAARDLGASEWQIITRVTLPLLKPALVTACLLAFLLSFDDFLVTFYTNGAGLDTLPVKLYTQMKTGLTPKLQALASLMVLATSALALVLVRLNRRIRFNGPRA